MPKKQQKIPRKVYRLTVFMAFGLLGLIGIQLYWVMSTVKENRKAFQQNVHKSLNNIIHQLERREGMAMMRERFRERFAHDPQFKTRFDSLYRPRQDNSDSVSYLRRSRDASGRQYQLELSMDTSDSTGKLRITEQDTPEKVPPFFVAEEEDGEQSRDKYFNRYIEKAVSLQEMLDQLAQMERPIEERVSRQVLDSVIRNELQNAGIETEYNFAVLNIRHEKILFADNIKDQIKILQSGFYHQLFPNDFKRSDNYLYLHFPKEQSYLLGNMWAILISSLLFLGLIVTSFLLAVRVILRQKALTEATTDFVNNMTHEFRTPISTISLATEMLGSDGMREMPEQHNRYVSMVRDETNRLSRQVEKVLQAARMERGDLQMHMELVNIHEIVEDAIQNVILLIEQREGTLHQQLEAEKVTIEGDFMHLNNIISGLLDNANKYSPDKPEITIKTYNVKKGVCINVFDKGKGISKSDLDKVFDRFYRVPTGDVHDVKGFGLGLSYVKTVVDTHQGEITVKSELGKGSCFSIFLPFRQNVHR